MKNNQPPIGVVIAQIGTPSSPDAQAVRPYLKRFLSDRRIIDYSPLFWQPLLRGVILRTRPRRSAELYKQIWLEAGSPLLLHSLAQQSGLQELLGSGYQVELGLAYSEPSMETAIARLEAAGVSRILILPLFPQYSSTTTASVYDQACFAALGRRSAGGPAAKRFVPALRLAEDFHDASGYIAAMKAHLERQLQSLPEEPDYYVLSFHGIPQRYADSGDPYPRQCMETARLLAAAMNWASGCWEVTFQSRFGPEKWVEPSTAAVLGELAGRGIQRPLVFSPGLVTDCLETLHELGVEGRELFAAGGGQPGQFMICPCLNDSPEWLEFLAGQAALHTAGWITPTSRPASDIH
ncbi:ferrochelatase [Paenibacillus donghaensis]|uniref:Coproporphyrin III ferrochelatase n=1 Tax=Paenibacillus donghaensis TaxID=414771 RepID=A0A2Z2KCL4_9BACL|nr:ferrochelatase [Paenibacillus donghaensis]ASA19699.1 ferrochelatase [Paenibacillus donghaensis]